MKILQNTCLISAVLAWAVAQLCKLLIELIAHHRLDWERLTGDGGMPSGHSATVTALAGCPAAIRRGFLSVCYQRGAGHYCNARCHGGALAGRAACPHHQ